MISEGSVTIRSDGHVHVDGFEFEGASCREACQLAMTWAIQKLSAAVIEDMTADTPKLSAIG
jgi:hypothetical protein